MYFFICGVQLGYGRIEEEASTQGMVGKDDSRVSTNCLILEALLEGNMKLCLKIKKSLHNCLCIYL